jgi:hypothetical protein
MPFPNVRQALWTLFEAAETCLCYDLMSGE